MSDPEETIDRRKFLTKSAALVAGGAAFASTPLSYDKILGANDRISVCHIGNGSRGGELGWIVSQLKTSQNVEITTVCDLWRRNREKAVAVNTKYYARAPRAYQYLEDVLDLKDVDAVIISTPEHSHSPILKMAVEAGKDAYVEKPMGNVLAEAKAARDAAMISKRIVQVASQRTSSQSGSRIGSSRCSRRSEQGGNCLELPRSPLAGTRGNKADPRTGYGLAEMAPHEAQSPV